MWHFCGGPALELIQRLHSLFYVNDVLCVSSSCDLPTNIWSTCLESIHQMQVSLHHVLALLGHSNFNRLGSLCQTHPASYTDKCD